MEWHVLSVLTVLALAAIGVVAGEAEAALDIYPVAVITNEMDGFVDLYGVQDVATTRISGHAYAVTTSAGGLHVINMTDPAAPAPVAALTNNMRGNDVAIARISDRTYAVTTAHHLDAHIVDITDPAAPTLIAVITNDTLRIPSLSFSIRDVAVTQISGHTYAIVTVYNLDDYDGVYIINITDPAAPALVAAIVESMPPWGFDPHGTTITAEPPNSSPAVLLPWTLNPSYIATAQISHYTYVVVTGGTGWHIINITDPAAPDPVIALTDDGLWGDVATTQISDRTYAVTTSNGLKMVDITDPAAPATVSHVNEFYLTTVPDSVATAQISGRTYAIFTDRVGVQTIDITDPTAPVPATALIDYVRGFNVGAVATAQISGHAYAVAATSDGLHILNMTDQAPRSDTTAAIPGYMTGFTSLSLPDSVAVTQISGRTYAVVTASNGVQVIDMATPVPVAAITNSMLKNATPLHEPRDVATTQISGRTYAVTTASSGVHILNMTDPAAPVPAAAITNDMIGFATGTTPESVVIAEISGRTYAVVTAWWQGAQIIDMTDPAAPALVAAIVGNWLPWLFDPHDVAITQISGRTYGVFTTSAGAQIVDMTDPAPTGTLWTDYGPRHVMDIVDMTDPTTVVADDIDGFIELDTPGSVAVAEISGRTYAVVTYGEAIHFGGAQIIDITDPASPVPVTTATGDGSWNDVAVAEISGRTYAVVTPWSGGAQIIDITDPPAPIQVAALTVEVVGSSGHYGTTIDITEISGRTYAIFATKNGVQTIDMTDPASPTPVTTIPDMTDPTVPPP